MNKIIKEWLLKDLVNWITEKFLQDTAKMGDLEGRLGKKANLDDELETRRVVSAILEYLDLKVSHKQVEDPSFDKPRPQMMDKIVVEKLK